MPTINGTAGDDTLSGTAGDDAINALAGNDTANGGAGNDAIDGGDGNDTINGEDGNDTLRGGVGSDVVNGGAGNDSLIVSSGDLSAGDQLFGGDGFDTVVFQGNSLIDITSITLGTDIEALEASTWVRATATQLDQLSSMRGPFEVVGTASLDLTGNAYMDGILSLGAGNDFVTMAGNTPWSGVTVWGNAGDDTIIASERVDSLQGGIGNDWIEGRGGNDSILGGSGNDTVLGGDGDDTIFGGLGTDTMDGGAGADLFLLDLQNGFGADDYVIGGSGIDTLNIAQSSANGDWRDFSQFHVSEIEILQGGNARFIMTVEQAAQFQSFQLGGLQLANAGTVTFGSNFNVSDFVLSPFGNTVDLTAGGNREFRIIGGVGNDTLLGSAGQDELRGGVGNDELHGNDNSDELMGGAGADWLDGGAGNDLLLVGIGETISAGDRFTGGSGTDALLLGYDPNFGWDQANPIFDLSVATIDLGIETVQALTARLATAQVAGFSIISVQYLHLADGGTADFSSVAYSGNLYLSDAGNHVVASNIASDFGIVAFGGAGDDTIIGSSQAVHDELHGGGGSDTLYGGGGNDLLDGGTGADTMDGGSGNDTYVIDNAGDIASEVTGSGIDVVESSVSFTLGAGLEVLGLTGTASINATGNALANQLAGNSGNNILDGSAGADTMAGGIGNDLYIIDNSGDTIVEGFGQGDDSAFVLGTYTLAQGASIETLVALNQGSTDPLVLTGNEFGQSLYGNLGDNYLNGGQGNDYLVGSGGNDSLLGGTGADHLAGGTGNDIYYVDAQGDLVTELAGEGDNDLLVATVSYALGAGASIETMSAEQTSANINLTGNELAQSIYGNAGDNIIAGGGGADYLVGGNGNDRYYVDTSDFIAEANGGGDDWIFVADSYILREGNEIETLVAVNQDSLAPVNLTGNEYGQSLYGSQGANSLNGGAGNDYLVGLGGNDFLMGGAGNDNLDGGQGNDVYYVDGGDQLFEAAGQGEDIAVAFASFTLNAGAHVETLSVAEGNAAINLTGNELAQTLFGNAGANVLNGGGGNDYLVGGAGNDRFVFTGLPGNDTIADFVSGSDKLDLTAFGITQTDVQATTSNGNTSLAVDTNHDGSADFTITLVGAGAPAAGDYLF